MGAELAAWSEFNVAMAGAAAALAGLLIVAMSVNIGRIMEAPTLSSRAAAAIAALVLALVVCALGLVPDAAAPVLGIEVSVLAVLALVFGVQAARRIAVDDEGPKAARPLKALLSVAAPACYLAAGILLVAGAPVPGLALAAIGCLVAIVASVVFAWVALVELLR